MKNNEQENDAMPTSVHAFLKKRGHFSFWMLYVIVGLFIAFLIWASFSEIRETTIGLGSVIPSRHVQVVDNLEGGILKELLVTEGQIVKKGQVLMRVENIMAEEKYEENQEDYDRFLAMKERLEAQIEGKPYKPSEKLIRQNPVLIKEQQRYFRSQQEKLNTEIQIEEHTIEQRKQDLENQKAQLAKFKTQHDLIQEQVAIKEPLAKKQLVSQIDFLNLKRDLEEQKGQIRSFEIAIPKAQSAVKEAEKKLKQLLLKFREDRLIELRELEQKLQDAKFALQTHKDRVHRTDIRSPVYGAVKVIKERTVGATIAPGSDLIEIVPLDDQLLIQAKVLPADIAFLYPGLDATVHISAYDFSIYGGLDAKLEKISADAIADEKGNSFFNIELRTKKNYLEYKGRKMPIIVGMQVTTHVFTGKRTVMDYILKPFKKAQYGALGEK